MEKNNDINELIINFAPTGMVPKKSQVSTLPVTPNEIIEQTHQAYDMGITMAHLHARDEDGLPTQDVKRYELIFEGLRRHCPELVICASLSGRGGISAEQRCEVLQLKPDMGSLTLSSLNFPGQASVNCPETIEILIDAMDQYGVKPELECFDPGMVNYAKYLIKKGRLTGPHYFNLLMGNIAGTQVDMAYAGLLIKDLPDYSFWSFAGFGKYQLTANTLAIATGGGVRVGLEDNIWQNSSQTEMASNLSLLARIHRIAQEFERPVMTPAKFGKLGFYNSSR